MQLNVIVFLHAWGTNTASSYQSKTCYFSKFSNIHLTSPNLLTWNPREKWVGQVLIPTHVVSESDNLGSTDSEVKKILTLHLPISEYDTLGSDSEGEIPGGQVAASQELVSFRHRMARGKYSNSSLQPVLYNVATNQVLVPSRHRITWYE